MNFTREPLIETVITSKDGHKLALRNSKGGSQEEYFVDAVEVITFGRNSFYRSLEKPKSFLLPVSDYEILEVRETRMVLKSGTVERGIKIAGGREKPVKTFKEAKEEESPIEEVEAAVEEQKTEKRRERRRTRKRRTKDEGDEKEAAPAEAPSKPSAQANPPQEVAKQTEKPTLIPPPSTLISETISRYKEIVIHETPQDKEEKPSPETEESEGDPSPKKEKESSEEPSADSSVNTKKAQPPEPIENDEELPI